MQQNYNKTASKQILYKMYKKSKKHFSNLYLNDNKITFKTSAELQQSNTNTNKATQTL